jgi:integrase
MSAALPPHRRPSVGRCGLLGRGAPNFLGKGDRLNSEGVYTPYAGNEKRAGEAGVAIRAGIHTTPSRSPTVRQAATAWLEAAAVNCLEATTIAGYRQHVSLHIAPKLGDLKLAKLTAPMIQAFIDELRATKSPILARKVLVSLKSMLRHAMTRGSVAQNVAASVKVESNNRHQKKLEVGRDIPTPTEIHRLLAVSCRLRPLLVVAVFCGLRASELRGLCWGDVDFDARTITVRQRADAYREMGMPKSEAGQRTIPLAPMTVNRGHDLTQEAARALARGWDGAERT